MTDKAHRRLEYALILVGIVLVGAVAGLAVDGVSGNWRVEGDLRVEGDGVFDVDVTIGDDIAVTDDATFGDDVTISGDATANSMRADYIGLSKTYANVAAAEADTANLGVGDFVLTDTDTSMVVGAGKGMIQIGP